MKEVSIPNIVLELELLKAQHNALLEAIKKTNPEIIKEVKQILKKQIKNEEFITASVDEIADVYIKEITD